MNTDRSCHQHFDMPSQISIERATFGWIILVKFPLRRIQMPKRLRSKKSIGCLPDVFFAAISPRVLEIESSVGGTFCSKPFKGRVQPEPSPPSPCGNSFLGMEASARTSRQHRGSRTRKYLSGSFRVDSHLMHLPTQYGRGVCTKWLLDFDTKK